jgi:multicomponent Na+:H+ antiporter subunit D
MTTAFTPGLPTALAVLGVGVNLGFLGLHYWVPDTYPRPHVAVSLVLAGYTTKVAVYALLRLLPDGATLVAFVGAATVVYAVWMAILQTDLRRLLSYHIVSQVGYMVTAVGVGTAAGTAGAVAHLTTHVVYKALLFAVAGALVYRTGTESLDRLGGLARRTPVTFAAFLVAALAIAGVPGFSGFVSKGLVVASVEGVAGDVLWWALVVGGVGTALSFAKVGYYVFVRPAPEPVPVRPAPRLLTATLVVLAVPSVAFGLAPGLLFGLVPGGAAGFQPYATSELTKATLVAGAGVAAFLLVRRRLGDLPDTDVDRLLHPVAFRLANDTARGLLAVGRRADDAVVTGVAAAGAALTPRRDTGPPGGRLGVALLVVAAALGLALLVAGVG